MPICDYNTDLLRDLYGIQTTKYTYLKGYWVNSSVLFNMFDKKKNVYFPFIFGAHKLFVTKEIFPSGDDYSTNILVESIHYYH